MSDVRRDWEAALMPRDPLPSGQCRRRNKDAPKTTRIPADAPGREAPPLPLRSPSKMTVEWWERIWASPISSIWMDVDLGGLHRLAILTDLLYGSGGRPPDGTLQEIRQLEDRFGLSPMSRRRLAWELEQAGAKDRVDAERPGNADDDDRWLRVVG